MKVDDNALILRGVDAGRRVRVDIPEKGGVVMRCFRFREYCLFQLSAEQAGLSEGRGVISFAREMSEITWSAG